MKVDKKDQQTAERSVGKKIKMLEKNKNYIY